MMNAVTISQHTFELYNDGVVGAQRRTRRVRLPPFSSTLPGQQSALRHPIGPLIGQPHGRHDPRLCLQPAHFGCHLGDVVRANQARVELAPHVRVLFVHRAGGQSIGNRAHLLRKVIYLRRLPKAHAAVGIDLLRLEVRRLILNTTKM